jgi:hypothetical protein
VRPSDFLAIENSLEAFYFDSAVYLFGVEFESDIEESTKSRGKKPDSPEMQQKKRERRVAKWVADGNSDTTPRFRDPNIEQRRG